MGHPVSRTMLAPEVSLLPLSWYDPTLEWLCRMRFGVDFVCLRSGWLSRGTLVCCIDTPLRAFLSQLACSPRYCYCFLPLAPAAPVPLCFHSDRTNEQNERTNEIMERPTERKNSRTKSWCERTIKRTTSIPEGTKERRNDQTKERTNRRANESWNQPTHQPTNHETTH